MRDGTEIFRCPSRIIRKDVKMYIDLYYDFKKGWLPFQGTKMQQPAKLMEIFDIIETLQKKEQDEKDRLQQRIMADGKR